MFDITPDDINPLNDIDLRELVGRLCEAELARRELSLAAVTWGGNQTAPDGGLDVRVTLPPNASIEGFVPRSLRGEVRRCRACAPLLPEKDAENQQNGPRLGRETLLRVIDGDR